MCQHLIFIVFFECLVEVHDEMKNVMSSID